jgi:hypothetical protein
MPDDNRVLVQHRMPPAFRDRIDRYARAHGMNRTDAIAALVRESLERWEDRERNLEIDNGTRYGKG